MLNKQLFYFNCLGTFGGKVFNFHSYLIFHLIEIAFSDQKVKQIAKYVPNMLAVLQVSPVVSGSLWGRGHVHA